MRADFEKGTKVCVKCKRELPIEEFGKNRRAYDGLMYMCKSCTHEHYIEYYYNGNGKEVTKKYGNSEKGKQASKRAHDKIFNTFQRKGCNRGQHGMLLRDYELTEKQLKRRNKTRHKRNGKQRTNVHGVLIWYDGKLGYLSSEEYSKQMNNEYVSQRNCAIRGYVGRKEPSKHFLFDFDLEQMLKDNVYYNNGCRRYYITKWWKGEIRHWTVNDGIWKE